MKSECSWHRKLMERARRGFHGRAPGRARASRCYGCPAGAQAGPHPPYSPCGLVPGSQAEPGPATDLAALAWILIPGCTPASPLMLPGRAWGKPPFPPQKSSRGASFYVKPLFFQFREGQVGAPWPLCPSSSESSSGPFLCPPWYPQSPAPCACLGKATGSRSWPSRCPCHLDGGWAGQWWQRETKHFSSTCLHASPWSWSSACLTPASPVPSFQLGRAFRPRLLLVTTSHGPPNSVAPHWHLCAPSCQGLPPQAPALARGPGRSLQL